MKKLWRFPWGLCWLLLLAVEPQPVMAQQPSPKTYDFAMKGLTIDQANMVLNKLGELPWKDVNNVLQGLIAQANEQSRQEVVTEPPPAAPQPPADPSKE